MMTHFARRTTHAGLTRLVCLCVIVWLAGLTQAAGMAAAGQPASVQLLQGSHHSVGAGHAHHGEASVDQHHRDCPMAESTLCAQLCALVSLPNQALSPATPTRVSLTAANLPLPATPEHYPPSPPPRAS